MNLKESQEKLNEILNQFKNLEFKKITINFSDLGGGRVVKDIWLWYKDGTEAPFGDIGTCTQICTILQLVNQDLYIEIDEWSYLLLDNIPKYNKIYDSEGCITINSINNKVSLEVKESLELYDIK